MGFFNRFMAGVFTATALAVLGFASVSGCASLMLYNFHRLYPEIASSTAASQSDALGSLQTCVLLAIGGAVLMGIAVAFWGTKTAK